MATTAPGAVQSHYSKLYQQLLQTANTKYFAGTSPSGQHNLLKLAGIRNCAQTLLALAMDAAIKAGSDGTRQQRRLLGLSAFDRHQALIKDAIHYYRAKLPPEQQTVKTDYDVLKEQYRFLRTDEDDSIDSWEVNIAKRYYAKLFKEYAIGDLSRYKESKVGLRWRTEQEVVKGKGQFICGAKGCDERRALASFEVNFAYKEAGESKQALVKLRLCPKHALQLNYKQNEQLLKKRKRDHNSSEETADARKNVEGVSKHDAASPDNEAHKHKPRSETKGKGGRESDSLLDELFM